jgi:hypothetical protein
MADYELRELERHVEGCGRCRRWLDLFVQSGAVPDPKPGHAPQAAPRPVTGAGKKEWSEE